MKNSIRWSILLLYVIASRTAAPCENDVRVHFKKDRRLPPAFLMLVRDNPFYVDKTRFIEYTLGKWLGRFVILTAPPGWGKSTLLNMLQYFFEAELDSRHQAIPPNRTGSYGFFAHGQLDSYVSIGTPLISHRADLIGQYGARHPVIKLHFEAYDEWIEIPSYDEFLNRFKNVMLKQIRDRHRAAMKTLCSDGRNLIGQRVPSAQLYDLCNNFDNDTLNEIELRHYASKWANWLQIYYAKSPVILVDGYDTIFKALYLTTGPFFNRREIDNALRTRIVDFFTDFLDITYRNSNSLFTLLTGVLPVDIGRGNLTYSRYSVFNHQHEDVYQYLGFTKQQTDELNCYEYANRRCGGYLVDKRPSVTVFNPLFILRSYQPEDEGWEWTPLDKLKTTLRSTIRRNRNVEKYVTDWLLDKRIPSCNRNHRRLLSFDQLRSMNNPGDEFAALLCSTDLVWLLGYLTYDHDQDHFKIPNSQCRETLEEALLGTTITSYLWEASTALIKLLENSRQTPEVFVNEYIHTGYWRYYDERIDFCLVTLYDIMRHVSEAHDYQCTAEINVTSETSHQEPISGRYLAIHNGTYGAVIEIKCGPEIANLSAVFRRDLSSRVNSFRRAYPHVKTLRMMIINLSPPRRQNDRKPIANYLDQVYYNADQH